MLRHISVNLGNLLLSLSDAIDLASPDLTQHQQRTAFVVWEMGRAGGISTERLERNFMAALLHDIGAFSPEEKIGLLKCEVKNTKEHSIRGAILFNGLPWLKDSSKIVRFHHREWQDWSESIETPLVFDSQLLFLSDYLERQIRRDHYILHQNEDIISNLRSLSGSLFHPEIVNLFCEVSNREEFWLDIVSPRLFSLLLHEGPFRRIEIALTDIAQISELFRNIIDFRSRFTSTHSSGVAASAAMLTRLFGLTETEIKLMEVAGNLHDLGKLAIPNSILEKPGKLTKKEMAIMKSHTYYTYSVINTIGGLQQIAEWAAYHHEKLDGSGYPFHCTAAELNTGARIMMVADMFTALAEDRPYRKQMSKQEIVRILKQFSDRGLLDTAVVNLVLENFEELLSCMSEKQTMAREFYESQFSSTE
ncbi:MAG: HD domain-containing protein [Deltaproteobacteria bacterium]|nr:HD domain-containing protein [Deltaproteobacteria bacterium]